MTEWQSGLIRTGRWCCESPHLWGSWHPYLLPSHTQGCQMQILLSCCHTVEMTTQGAEKSCFELCRDKTTLLVKNKPQNKKQCPFPCPWNLHWDAEENDQEEHQHHATGIRTAMVMLTPSTSNSESAAVMWTFYGTFKKKKIRWWIRMFW